MTVIDFSSTFGAYINREYNRGHFVERTQKIANKGRNYKTYVAKKPNPDLMDEPFYMPMNQ